MTQNNGTFVLSNGASRTFAGTTSASLRGDTPSATFPNAGTIVIGNGSTLGINGAFAPGSNGKLEVVIGSANQPPALNVSGTIHGTDVVLVKSSSDTAYSSLARVRLF